VERALDLLAAVVDGEKTLTECARRSQLPASTALRLLRTLEAAGFVSRAPDGRFGPGTRLVQIGAQALSRNALVRMATPGLHRIVARTGESAYLSMLGPSDTALYVAVAEGTHTIRHTSWVGRSVPMAGLAIGEALRGEVPPGSYVAQRDAQEPDVTAVVAPIASAGGVAGALSLLGPTYRIDEETMHRYGDIVAGEARTLAEQLGVSAPARRTTQREAAGQ
jgi:urocanate hydratase